jgi:hypothetical protein
MLIIDRLEGDCAILEYEQGTTSTCRLPRCLLPPGAKERDILRIITVTIDAEETAGRKNRITGLLDELFQ